MDRTTFFTTVFCLVDDWLAGRRVRQRGPAPVLHDSEVLTIEIAGSFLGVETDEGLDGYFRRYYPDCFPALRRVDRTTFTRQAANLWKVKEALWQHLLTRVAHDPLLSIVDSCPLPVCRFARAPRCRRLREYSAFGYDELARQTYYGLRLHLRICWPGVIVGFSLAPANAADLPVAEADLLPDGAGWVLADRNYWREETMSDLAARGIRLLAPYKTKTRESAPWPRWLTHTRRRIETVLGQLVERYHTKRVWARDAWHLWSRWLRCVLSHTVAVLLCQSCGLSPLQFDTLLTD